MMNAAEGRGIGWGRRTNTLSMMTLPNRGLLPIFPLPSFRYNTAQLEQWARDQKVHSEQINVIESLTHIVQASQLLQVRI